MAYKETEARELIISAVHRLTEAGLVARTWGNVAPGYLRNNLSLHPAAWAMSICSRRIWFL